MQVFTAARQATLAAARNAISSSPVVPGVQRSAATAVTIPALRTSFPFTWLRDACQCPACVHPSTRQKLHRTSDIPLGIRPVPKPDGLRISPEGLHIEWAEHDKSHKSFYPVDFLDRYSSKSKEAIFHRETPTEAWDAQQLAQSPNLFVPYASLSSPSGLLTAMTHILRFGLLFVTDVPTEETSDNDCEVKKLAQTFGEIRTTFYGEMWDVKNVKNSRNIAYTNLDLGLHMDLLYFQHPPRYQILHCLRNRVTGGTSLFVDAFQTASLLHARDPAAFHTLATTPVAFHYINAGHHLHHVHPTIALSPFSSSDDVESTMPQITHVSYSPPFQAPLPLSTPPTLYPALASFAALTTTPNATFAYTLREGDAAIFDNRRVLHARTAFREKEGEGSITGSEGPGETSRWLKGCYLEADGLLDRARMAAELVHGPSGATLDGK